MNKKIFFLITFLLAGYFLFAQYDGSSVVVYKDPRIDVLMKKQSEINNVSTRAAAASRKRSARGYRLLVVTTNNRNEAISAKTKLYTYFPELKSYMWHQSPFYKVKTGNFVSRAEAANYQKRLAPHFPNGVSIMSDIVEVKPEPVENEY